MSKTGRINHRRGTRGRPKAERHITVRSVRRDPPDLHKLSRAVIAIALRQVELEAERKPNTTLPAEKQLPDAAHQVDDNIREMEQPHD